MVMPHVLDFYADAEDAGINERFCELAAALGVPADATAGETARTFIAKVREMNAEMAVPSSVDGMTADDISAVGERALEEAHGVRAFDLLDFGYPVPQYMAMADMVKVLEGIVPEASDVEEEVAVQQVSTHMHTCSLAGISLTDLLWFQAKL